MNLIMIGLLLREALDRLHVHLNMYLVINTNWSCFSVTHMSKHIVLLIYTAHSKDIWCNFDVSSYVQHYR